MNDCNKALNISEEWQRALTTVKAANILASQQLWEDATSRAYYAAFHATQAVLLTESLQPKSHQGTLHLFNYHFVKSGRLDPKYTQILARAAKYREEADYRHAMTFTEDQTTQTIREVHQFLDGMNQFLTSLGYKLP